MITENDLLDLSPFIVKCAIQSVDKRNSAFQILTTLQKDMDECVNNRRPKPAEETFRNLVKADNEMSVILAEFKKIYIRLEELQLAGEKPLPLSDNGKTSVKTILDKLNSCAGFAFDLYQISGKVKEHLDYEKEFSGSNQALHDLDNERGKFEGLRAEFPGYKNIFLNYWEKINLIAGGNGYNPAEKQMDRSAPIRQRLQH